MHYYQHNIGDYARDTGHLTVLEHGIYRLLLDWCYLNEKPITTEQAVRVSRGNPVETQSVLSEFFSQESEGWTHKRVVIEIQAYHAKAEKNRQNGAKGGRPKPTNNPAGSQTDAKHNLNHKPLTNINTPIPPAKTPGAAAAVSLQTWLATIKAMGEQPMPETDPVFDYAEQAGIPMEYMRLCWVEFKQRYSAPGAKKYKDWRSVYRKAVRGNWFKLWRLSNDSYVLTTEGQQALRVAEAKAVAA